MKKKFSFLLVLAVLVMGLSACGSSKSDTTSETKATKGPKSYGDSRGNKRAGIKNNRYKRKASRKN